MTTKIIATAVATGAVAFAAGGYLGLNHASHEPLPPAPELPQHSQTIASLSHHTKNILQGVRGGSYLIELGLGDHDTATKGDEPD